MKLAYIAGPYRAKTPWGVQQNINRAADVAAKYWLQGYTVICPHKNTALFDGLAPDDVWLKGGLEILRRCDVVIMMLGWEQSEGAKAEYEEARWLGKEIIFE